MVLYSRGFGVAHDVGGGSSGLIIAAMLGKMGDQAR